MTLNEGMCMDLIIRGADVLDGSGTPAFRADIGIDGDRIAAIGDLSAAVAGETIDGTGRVVTPGFIDIHSHSDYTLPINPRAESKIRQGVTTEVVGMCGGSAAPLDDVSRARMVASNPDLPWDEWTTFGEYLGFLRRQGTSVNVIPFVGHGTVRGLAMGLGERAPTASELSEMKRLVAQAMDEGAWGMSTGLIYPPSVYGDTEELVELARVPAARGGFYFSHIRGEGATLLDAVAEAIEIGERAGLPVQIAHFKASGVDNWGLLPQALSLLDVARERGVDVMADRYPYIASSTGLGASLPHWAHDGGRDALLDRLREAKTRARILDDPGTQSTHWDKIVIASVPDRSEWEGQSVAEIAAQRGTDPTVTALDLLLEAEGRVSVIRFGMSEENLCTVLRHPAVMIGSDGSARAPYGVLGQGKAHPRNYGTFPRVLGRYAREQGVLSLAEAVHKMTGKTAGRLRLADRGLLRAGYKADLVLLDPETVGDAGTYSDPYQYAMGIEAVVVNGQVVIQRGEHTGALPGRVLGL